jgi:hypothetical protein
MASLKKEMGTGQLCNYGEKSMITTDVVAWYGAVIASLPAGAVGRTGKKMQNK